jgi:hypothetical protein
VDEAGRIAFLYHNNQDEDDMTHYACDLATELEEPKRNYGLSDY